MFLDGDLAALAAYHAGDHSSSKVAGVLRAIRSELSALVIPEPELSKHQISAAPFANGQKH
jgi:hypothetical protein